MEPLTFKFNINNFDSKQTNQMDFKVIFFKTNSILNLETLAFCTLVTMAFQLAFYVEIMKVLNFLRISNFKEKSYKQRSICEGNISSDLKFGIKL